CDRSQRANAVSMASARSANVWLGPAAITRPGRGQNVSARPSTSSTVIDHHVFANVDVLVTHVRTHVLLRERRTQLVAYTLAGSSNADPCDTCRCMRPPRAPPHLRQ